MHQLELSEAGFQLAVLLEKAAGGEEVVITRDDGAAFKLVPIEVEKPYPKFGSAKGLIEMSEDFDEPLSDFEDYEP